MRRLKLVLLMMAVAVATARCGGGGDDGGDEDIDTGTATTAASATTVAVATTAGGTTVAPTPLTLRMTDVRLVNSEESDSGMRVLLPAGVASASVTVSGLPSPNRVISVCQARELERRMNGATCRMPANGEAVTLTLGSAATGIELAQVGLAGPGPEGNSALLSEVLIRYSAGSRELNVRLPQVASSEAGTTFGLTPPSPNGTYRAQMNWTIIPVYGGTPVSGQLQLLQGGNVANQAVSGGVEVRFEGTVSPPGEASIRVQNLGTAALVAPKLAIVLP